MNVVDADETAIRYNLFLGSLILKKEDKSIVIDWDWVPLIDFAICLRTICNSLLKKMHSEEEFEFTESDSRIMFQKDGDKITIATSFSDEIIEISFEEFQKAVSKFYKEVIFEAVEKNKEIKNNDSFIEYLKEVENM